MNSKQDIHEWFELSYSNYLVLPRTLLQSMPEEWQYKFTEFLTELEESFELDPDYTGSYWVRMQKDGKFATDPYRDYERGRRKIPLKEPKE